MMLRPEIYQLMESSAPWLAMWIAVFAGIQLFRIVRHLREKREAAGHSTLFVESAGLPLTLMHSVCFVYSLILGDWISALLFAWWGPGFIYVAALYLSRQKRGLEINWNGLKQIISWACKLNYLAFLLIYIHFECWMIIYVFSIWIINDQCGMCWISQDADRLRRTFDDFWIIRACYAAGLFIPFYFEVPGRILCLFFGLHLFLLWSAGVRHVVKVKKFKVVPDDRGLLRNMVYFKERDSGLGTGDSEMKVSR